jgi:hypothetical protein
MWKHRCLRFADGKILVAGAKKLGTQGRDPRIRGLGDGAERLPQMVGGGIWKS